MDWVPLLFIDDVCHQLPSSALKPVSELSGTTWSSFGSEHCGKRRELTFGCRVEDQQCDYFFERRYATSFSERVKLCDLNLDYDRCTISAYELNDLKFGRCTLVSVDELQRVVLPAIVSITSNSSWPRLDRRPEYSAHNEIFLKAFKNCPGFNEIHVVDQSKDSRDFFDRQLELGNVESIYVHNQWPTVWIEPEKLTNILQKFVSSARFKELLVYVELPNTFELFALFLERAIAGELKEGARIIILGVSEFDKNRLSALHPKHREGSEELAWSIPNSNRRVVERSVKEYFVLFRWFYVKSTLTSHVNVCEFSI